MRNMLKLAVVAGVSTFASATGFAQTAGEQTAVQTIIDGQITAFKSGSHEKAFGYAAPHLKEIFGSTDRFIGMVKNGYGAIYGAQQWSFGRSTMLNGELLQEVLLTGPKGRDWVAVYTMRKQPDGSWRIAGVQMKRANAQST